MQKRGISARRLCCPHFLEAHSFVQQSWAKITLAPFQVELRFYIKPWVSTELGEHSPLVILPSFYVDLRCYIKPCISTKIGEHSPPETLPPFDVDLRCYIKPCISTKPSQQSEMAFARFTYRLRCYSMLFLQPLSKTALYNLQFFYIAVI